MVEVTSEQRSQLRQGESARHLVQVDPASELEAALRSSGFRGTADRVAAAARTGDTTVQRQIVAAIDRDQTGTYNPNQRRLAEAWLRSQT